MLVAINDSNDPFLDNIRFEYSQEYLEEKAGGFARFGKDLSLGFFRGCVAAGYGIVFRTQMPSDERVEGDFKSYYTRKSFYAFGLKVWCSILDYLLSSLYILII